MINLASNISVNLKYLLSFVISFLSVIILLPRIIKFIKLYKIYEKLRDLNIDYSSKSYIPSMGGLAIVPSVCLSYILFSNLNSKLCFTLPLIYIGFALIGLLDDYLKIVKGKSGLNPIFKILGQLLLCLLFLNLINNNRYIISMPFHLKIPFINQNQIEVGTFTFFIFIFFVLSGASNAVNLADGLDGFAPLNLLINFIFIFFYVLVKRDTNSIEIAIFTSSIIGATLGFIWYNSYPAQIIMGDVGSLSYGGILGILFSLIKQELALILVGLIFFIEASSVILQKLYRFIRGKSLFKLTPIHHHYELNGIHENKIVMRSFIISIFSFILSIFLSFL